jgi:hypothetical protein
MRIGVFGRRLAGPKHFQNRPWSYSVEDFRLKLFADRPFREYTGNNHFAAVDPRQDAHVENVAIGSADVPL